MLATLIPVLFWLMTVGRYLLAAIVASVLSVTISILATVAFLQPGDDLGGGFLFTSIFVPLAGLLVPVCLGITAELIQRKVFVRPFTWSKALLRSLMALPIAAGPVYATATSYFGNRRPTHWAEKEILLYGLSVVSGYFALRIRKQPLQVH